MKQVAWSLVGGCALALVGLASLSTAQASCPDDGKSGKPGQQLCPGDDKPQPAPAPSDQLCPDDDKKHGA